MFILFYIMATGSEKVGFHSNHKGIAKECSNYYTTALISHASKVMLIILQARLQQCVNQELPDVQTEFRKGRGTRDQIVNICWIMEKAREFQENIYFCFINYTKAFNCVDHNKLWKILKEMGVLDYFTYLSPEKQQLEPDMEQLTGSELWKEDDKAIYCHLAYLTYMKSTTCEMPGWMNLEQAGITVARKNINNLRYEDYTTPQL